VYNNILDSREAMKDFRNDQQEWWDDWKDEDFDYPHYPETTPDPSNFDLDIPN
jgi:uncharacterized protein YjlB